MRPPILLSRAGSDRATAYAMSNKLLRHEGKLYVGWLDAALAPGGPERIQLGICDGETGALERAFLLGEGVDNHCGPALALDGGGRMHAIVGAHGGDFLYRWSESPGEPEGWSPPEPLGPFDTYPSLVVDGEDTLHLLSRESGPHPRKLIYRRKPTGVPWETPVALALSPRPGYTHFMHCLSVGPGGRLHATFQYHYALDSLSPLHAVGRMAAYIWSDDSGRTWRQESGPVALPLTLETTLPFLTAPDGGIRISNHVVDARDRVWIFSAVPEKPGGVLLRRDASGWEEIATERSLGVLDNRNGRETSLSRDADGVLHLVISTAPGGESAQWADPRHELFHLALDEEGRQQAFRQMTPPDPARAHWLPALENWSWAQPGCQGGPWMAHTQENDLDDGRARRTNVFLTRLAKADFDQTPQPDIPHEKT